jgi:2-polyprenyl-6-hydroxyphenyl methylase/3-demethylubiquinone-9 3-methyltransferase
VESPGNIDILEIEHFDRFSPAWWDPHGELGTLHTINPMRMHFITENSDLAGLTVLDVGCGGGILSEAMVRLGARVTGVDLSEASISVARHHAQSQGLQIDYHCEHLEDFAIHHPGNYDIVTCMEMLEHVPKPEQIIAGCAQVVKAGGKVYFSTINRTLKAFLFAILIGEYVLHLLPRGSHKYRRLIRPQELKGWAEKNDLEYGLIASLMYNPLSGKFKLVEHKEDINYLAQFNKRN